MTTTISTSQGNYNFTNKVQNMKITTVQKAWDYMGGKEYDKTESRSFRDYKEFPMPAEINDIMSKLMASDKKKEDFSFNDFNAAKAKLEKMGVDIKEYNASTGILSFLVKGYENGYNDGKTYVFTLDIETPEEIDAQKNAERAEKQAREEAELDKRYAEKHWFRSFFGITREDYEKTNERDY